MPQSAISCHTLCEGQQCIERCAAMHACLRGKDGRNYLFYLRYVHPATVPQDIGHPALVTALGVL